MKPTDVFYHRLKEPNRSYLEATRIIILKEEKAITESLKYGTPFFQYQNRPLCYFWIEKKTTLPYIGFKHGMSLDFPWLEAGDRRRFKIMRLDPYDDIPLKALRKTLRASIEIYHSVMLRGKRLEI